MKRILLIILALLILFVSPIMAEEDEKTKILIQNNCASCHTLRMPHPSTISSFPAPPMNAVIFHLKSEVKNYEKQKEFISQSTT